MTYGRSSAASIVRLGAVLALLLVLPPAASVQPANDDWPEPTERGCRYFTEQNFRGDWEGLAEGTSLGGLRPELDNQISSIACYTGCQLLGYEDPGLDGERLTSGSEWYVGNPWNDRISSVQVICGSEVFGRDRGQCVYYDTANRAGERVTVRENREQPVLAAGWNDRISSIACDSHCSLDVFEFDHFRGARENLSGREQFPANWNNRISSVRTRCGPRDD